MRKNTRILPVLCLIFLTSCAITSVNEDYSFNPALSNGLILVSVTQNSIEGTDSTVSSFVIKNKKGSFNEKITTLDDKILYFNGKKIDKDTGKLLLIEAPAGEYFIDYWWIKQSTMTLEPQKKPKKINFNVKKNKITYIGNLHVHLSTGTNFFGTKITNGGIPLVRNRYDRDIKLFFDKYVNLSDITINTQIPFEGVWVRGFEKNRNLQDLYNKINSEISGTFEK